MITESFQLKTCPACQGFGLLSQDNGTVTCPTCFGLGQWMENEGGKKLFFKLPEVITPHDHLSTSIRKAIHYSFSGLSFAVFLGSAFYIASQAPNLKDLLWQRGFSHFLLGASGLTSMWALASLERHHTSTRSLHDLEADLASDATHSLDFSPYANPRVNELFSQAALIAQELHSNQIDEAILLITLLRQPRIQVMIARLELSAATLTDALSQFVSVKDAGASLSMSIHPLARQRVYAGIEEALAHDFPYLDLEDIFLSYFKNPGPFENLFHQSGLTYDNVYAVTRWYAEEQERLRQWQFWLERGRTRPKGYMNKAWTALPTPFLDQYSIDITRQAAGGEVATAVVREEEINQILQVLGRTQKNSVLLVGEPGVGKSTILGAVALRMIEENVPEILKDKRLVSVDIGALLNASQQSAEQSMHTLLEEVTQAGNVILAIPEVQVLVGTSDNALDAAALLSQALSHQSIQVITTATYGDYHRYVESNATLTSLLDIVEIKEVNQEQAITILEEEAPNLEVRQKVFLTYPALASSVELAHRYFPEKMLPESALSLLDEAASKLQQEGKRKWVTKQDVEEIVEQKTRIPVREAGQQEAAMLLNLESKLHQKIIGQEEAVKAVADALRRARAGLHTGKRPISSFMFVGPTGVGKTETAKAVSEIYFGEQSTMLRLDMSEYQDAKAVYKLIGAPAASSESYTEGGALTQPIREHPFSLILLDEIEKANPDVLNLFLQLLDDGRLTENTGRTVFFNNTIIVATSNAGSTEILQLMQQGVSLEELPKQILRILQSQFKPEFLNRFDAIIPFHPLKPEEIEQITTLMLKEIIKTTADQHYTITFAPDAISKIAQLGYDPLYGARPLRRIVQEKVEGLLAKKILDHSLTPGGTLQITASMLE